MLSVPVSQVITGILRLRRYGGVCVHRGCKAIYVIQGPLQKVSKYVDKLKAYLYFCKNIDDLTESFLFS